MSIPLADYVKLLSKYLEPRKAWVFGLFVLFTTTIGLQLVNPQILKTFIDSASTKAEPTYLITLAILFVVIAFSSQILSIGASYLSERISWSATNALRIDLVRHCLGLDMAFHKAHPPGELIERIDGDINVLANFFSTLVIQLLGNLCLVLGILVLIFRENVFLGMGLASFCGIAFAVLTRIRSFSTPFWVKLRQINAEFYGFLGEHLMGTADIRANGAQQYVMGKLYEMQRRWLPLRVKAHMAFGSMWVTTISIFALGNLIAFVVGAALFWRE
jgi:ATP-binding cassette subfamily B protein